MSTITLKKTKAPQTDSYGSKGRRMTTPASYDILLNGKVVGEMWGYCDTKIADGGCGHHAKAFGQRLDCAALRGKERALMEQEIITLAADRCVKDGGICGIGGTCDKCPHIGGEQ